MGCFSLEMLGWAWENRVIDSQWGIRETSSYKGFYASIWYVTTNEQVLAADGHDRNDAGRALLQEA